VVATSVTVAATAEAGRSRDEPRLMLTGFGGAVMIGSGVSASGTKVLARVPPEDRAGTLPVLGLPLPGKEKDCNKRVQEGFFDCR